VAGGVAKTKGDALADWTLISERPSGSSREEGKDDDVLNDKDESKNKG
jgi:hypothetical protein